MSTTTFEGWGGGAGAGGGGEEWLVRLLVVLELTNQMLKKDESK